MKVLVTGGAGFIGSHTVDALVKNGHKVRVLDNLQDRVHPHGPPAYLNPEAEFFKGDVRNISDWDTALTGIDVVYHLAAYQDYMPDFSTFFHVNTVAPALLLERIVNKDYPVQKIIFASSQAVYGEGLYKCELHGNFIPSPRPLEQLRKGAVISSPHPVRWNNYAKAIGKYTAPHVIASRNPKKPMKQR
jgi:dTDP-L-rhamnose 4-epimerase